nr:MAG TPA_asm: hypothetical protein [Caudoviricetes sp.]
MNGYNPASSIPSANALANTLFLTITFVFFLFL